MEFLQTDDTGLFLGLMSLPFGHEKDFYTEKFENGLFKIYKASIEENLDKKHDTGKTFKEFHNFLLSIFKV